MITAADVDTLLFDVIGTVVDEGGTMRAEVAAELEAAGLAGPGRAGELAAAWEERSWSLTAELDRAGPGVSTDEVNARALADVLAGAGGGPAAALPAAAVRRLGLVGHRLRPWPDAAAALATLARRFTVVALSNGNLSMLASVSARGGLTWHAVLSAELVGARKPDPAVYRFALDRLALDPGRTLMVAAHPWDLRAAAACGLRTAYIERAGEGRPEPSDSFDLSCPDLAALAAHLTGG
jgi:2-haloacid dehalogenase